MSDHTGRRKDGYAQITIRGMKLGNSIPKICVPVVETTAEAIVKAAAEVRGSAADLMEWRADFYEEVKNQEKVTALLTKIRQELGEIPLLVTYRTRAEGGSAKQELTPEEYETLNQTVLASGQADLIDVELRMGEAMAKGLIAKAHRRGEFVLLSSHDFGQTPPKEEMLRRYEQMEDWGADILKLAVMPANTEDLLTLLTVCREASVRLSRPVVAISMGDIGLESRICAEAFGSAITFGCLAKASAPGQIDAENLAQVLRVIHQGHAGHDSYAEPESKKEYDSGTNGRSLLLGDSGICVET